MENNCPYCQRLIPVSSVYCVHCGKELSTFVDRNTIGSLESNQNVYQKKIWNIVNYLTFTLAIICIGAFAFYFIENRINTPADKDSKNEEIKGNLYRNTKYNFRVKFPVGWLIENGDGPNVLVKASSDNGSSINIGVKDLGIAQGDIDAMMTIDEWAEFVYVKFPDANILLKKEIAIDNRKAFLVKYSIKYKVLDKEANSTGYSVAFTNKNILYTLTASSKTRLFEAEHLTLETSMSTFVIEN